MAEKGRELLYQRGDGEGFLTTVAANGTPRIHPLNVGIREGRLLVFIQAHSAKARDLESNPRYALHAHQDAAAPHEFMVRGEARLVTDPAVRQAAAAGWFFESPTRTRCTSSSSSKRCSASETARTTGRPGIVPGGACEPDLSHSIGHGANQRSMYRLAKAGRCIIGPFERG